MGLIVRRTRLVDSAQARLWSDSRHRAFLTDLDGPATEIDAFHRAHATCELAIRDLKEGAGLEHVPSGRFVANSAWLQLAVLAHNLIRWTAFLGQPTPIDRLTAARTVRLHLLAIPGRIVNPARHPRPDRQPLRHHYPARTDPMAMSSTLPPAATGPARLTNLISRGPGAPLSRR